MSSVHYLREYIGERLTAAAAEIFSEFEKTILRYEEEIDRQRRLLDLCWKPELKLHRVEQDPVHETPFLTDQQEELLEQPPWIKEEQDEAEPVEIKAEEEELCTGEEEYHLVTTVPEDYSEPEPDRDQLTCQSPAGPRDQDQDSGSNENEDQSPKKTERTACYHGDGAFIRPREEGSTAAAQDQSRESRNPWSHLKDYFVFTSREESNARVLCFRCVMCRPKDITIKGQVNSFYNLKSHVRRKHPAHAAQFEERVKAGSSRGKHRRCLAGQEPPPGAKRARHLGEASAPRVDPRIVELFGDDALSLHVVETPNFIGLIKMLNPNETSTSCGSIMAGQKELQDYLTRPPAGTGPQAGAGSDRPAALQPEEEVQPGPEGTRTSTD
ncbi:uncharacterized protein LOC106527209 isoform X2 [Austrofundulus limnaeus]|uniref:Uncharacterized protein LOC106527209 isoform X2 n=1 Tax=Austrofundulus limnaeus TaxID=52670 RepID=A0A2I4CBW7_AUSLI|nr:PREDICTED: uncharacterized protein LOC106527209 isoform X2 [Austrofundulus limnaeus]